MADYSPRAQACASPTPGARFRSGGHSDYKINFLKKVSALFGPKPTQHGKFVARGFPFQSSKKNKLILTDSAGAAPSNKKNSAVQRSPIKQSKSGTPYGYGSGHPQWGGAQPKVERWAKPYTKLKKNLEVRPAKLKLYEPFIKIKSASGPAAGLRNTADGTLPLRFYNNKGFSKGKRHYNTLPASREVKELHEKINRIFNITKIQSNVICNNYNELSPNFYSDVSRFLSPSFRTLPLHMKLKGDRPSFMHNYEINGKSQ